MSTKIERDFEAAGRQFTIHASLTTCDDINRTVFYGAHVTEAGTDDLAFNGDMIPANPDGDAWTELVFYVNAVARRVEDDAKTCEHGLSAWLCEGPMHYPADDEMAF